MKEMKTWFVDEMDLKETATSSRDVAVVYQFIALENIEEAEKKLKEVIEAQKGNCADLVQLGEDD